MICPPAELAARPFQPVVGWGDRRLVCGVQFGYRCDAAKVAGKSQRRREAAAGTSAAGIFTGPPPVGWARPGQRRVAVAQGGRTLIFRRQAVVHRCDSDAQSAAEMEAEPIVRCAVPIT